MKLLLVLVQLAMVCTAAAQETDYPTRPIKQIVPFPPGGGVDIVTRIVGAKWSEFLGQPIIVENRPGAGGTVGADAAAKAAGDGYTLLSCGVASHGVSPALYNKLGYDAIKDFAPVGIIGKTPNVLVVHPSVPARNLREFIDYVKASPGKYNYASPGYGTSPQMTMELFKLTAGVNLVHIPYKGGAPALADVMAGQVTGMFGNLPEQLAAIKSGKTRALAVSTLQRNAQLPEVPTVAEARPRQAACDAAQDLGAAGDESAARGGEHRRHAQFARGDGGFHPPRDRHVDARRSRREYPEAVMRR